ncbi:MAG: hypothetical protein VX871_10175 [Pseudomonadota bacterium]|nr:hypothetical protein [Pseudomonadota bacterium]
MLDWFLIAAVTAGAAFGGEYARRRAMRAGRIAHFQPVWSWRLLTVLGAMGGAFFIETARIALSHPSERHVWYLSAVSVFTFVVVSVEMALELKHARKRLPEVMNTAS